MYNNPIGGVAAGAGGSVAASPFIGMSALWLGLAIFTLFSTALAVKRILPSRKG